MKRETISAKPNVKISLFVTLISLMIMCAVTFGIFAQTSATAELTPGSSEWVEAHNSNIEDVITSLTNTDLYSPKNTSGTLGIAGYGNDNTYVTAFDDAQEVHTKQTITAYTTKKTDADSAQNLNEYDGNISLYSYSTLGANNKALGFYVTADEEKPLLSLKIAYKKNMPFRFFARRSSMSSYYNAVGTDASDAATGYAFLISSNSGGSGYSKNSIYIISNYNTAEDGATKVWQNRSWTNTDADYAEYWNFGNKDDIFGSLTDGEIIDVTYGVVNNTVYMKWTVASTGALVFQFCREDAHRDRVKGYDAIKGNGIFGIGVASAESMYAMIGGVNQPIVYTPEDGGVADITGVTEGNLLSTAQLPTGYEWKNPNTLLKAGKNEYEAVGTLSYEYYGQRNREVTVSVNVTAEPIDRDAWVDYYNTNIEDMGITLDNLSDRSVMGIAGHSNWVTNFDTTATIGNQTVTAYNSADSENSNNANDYDGNIGLYITNTEGSRDAGIQVKAPSKDSLLSFKIRYYDNLEWKFSARRDGMNGWQGAYAGLSNGKIKDGDGGYQFRINQSGNSNYIRIARGYYNEDGTLAAQDTQVNSAWQTQTQHLKNNVKNNDVVTVTYGVVDNADGTSATVYMKWYNETQNKLIFEYSEIDPYGAKVAGYDRIKNGTAPNVFAIGVWKPEAYTAKITIAGAKKPIVTNSGAEDIVGGTEGDLLSSVDAPDGFEWKNPNTLLKAGKHSYEAVGDVSYEYYGKTVTETNVTCLVNVTATAIDRDAWVSEYNRNIEQVVTSLTNTDLANRNVIGIAGYSDWVTSFDSSTAFGTPATQHVTAYKTAGTEGSNNANDYDGNIGLYVANTAKDRNAGIQVKAPTKDSLLSFKIRYQPDLEWKLFARRDGMNGWQGAYSEKNSTTGKFNNATGGYQFRINQSGHTNYIRIARGYYDEDGTAVSDTQVNSAWQTQTQYLSNNVANNDVVTVTYGVVDNADGTSATVYMKWYNETQNKVIFEYAEIDPYGSKVAGYDRIKNGTAPNVFAIGIWKDAESYSAKITVAGVEKPIMPSSGVAGVTGGTEGDKLSTVTAPTGFAWVDGDTRLQKGTHGYQAVGNVSYEYYGKQVVESNVTCSVNVTAAGINVANLLSANNRNIEDFISSLENSDLSGRSVLSISSYNYWLEKFNEVLEPNEKLSKIAAYTTKKTDSNSSTNQNDYDGNISLYAQSSYNTADYRTVGLQINRQDVNALLSLKIKYQPGEEWKFFARRNAMTNYFHSIGANNEMGGYLFRVNESSKVIRISSYLKDGSTSNTSDWTHRFWDVPDTATIFAKLSENDMITVTYGVVDNANGTATVYMRWVKDATDTAPAETVFEYYHIDEEPQNVRGYVSTHGENGKNIFGIGVCAAAPLASSTAIHAMIGGVDKPLVPNANVTVSGTYVEGALLSSVTLPDGFAWKNDNTRLEAGTRNYEAVGDIEIPYYGGTVTLEGTTCSVTVTATAIDRTAFVNEHNTNIEQLVTSLGDSELTGRSNMSIAMHGGWIDAFNKEKELSATQKATAYTVKDASNEKNLNDYDGNIALYANSTISENNSKLVGLQVYAGKKNALLTFKLKYRPSQEYRLYARRNGMTDWYGSLGGSDEKGGYQFRVNTFGNNNEIRIYSYVKDGSAGAAGDTGWTSRYWSVPDAEDILAKLSANDMVTVTYGAVDNDDGTVTVYMKWVKDATATTQAQTLFEFFRIDDEGANVKAHNVITDSNNVFGIGVSNKSELYAMIGGVDKPLVLSADVNVTGDYTEGELLDSVTLPTGYTWETPTARLKAGTNSYNAIGSVTIDDYYGKKVEESGVTCAVSVTATKIDRDAWSAPYKKNIEQVVTSLTNADLTSRAKIAVTGAGNDNNSGSYTTFGAEQTTYNTSAGTQTMTVYNTKKSGDSDTANPNDYAGNIGINMTATKKTDAAQISAGVQVVAPGKDTLLSYKMTWQANVEYRLYARRHNISSNYFGGLMNGAMESRSGGYLFRFNTFAQDRVRVTYANPTDTYSETVVSDTSSLDFRRKLSDGDMLTVTFGAVSDGNVDTLYMKWVKDATATTEEEVVYEYCEMVEDASSVLGRQDIIDGKANNVLAIGVFVVGGTNTPVTWKTTIAGVDKPIAPNADMTVTSGSYTEGDELSSVTLPTGYTWKDADEVTLEEGASQYDAVFGGTYYGGKTYTVNCKVTVTAAADAVYYVNFVDSDGLTVRRRASVKQHTGKYKLPTGEGIDVHGKFVGWVVNGKLRSAGTEIAVSDDMTVTLAAAEFGMPEGQMRKSGGEYKFGFEVSISTSQLAEMTVLDAEVSVEIKWMVVYAPEGSFSGELTAETAGAQKVAVPDANRTRDGYFTKAFVPVNSTNNGVKYVARTYLAVSYPSGAKQNFYSAASEAVSVADASKVAYVWGDLPAEDKEQLLDNCINGIVELYRRGDEFVVVTYEDGLERERAYSISGVTVGASSVTMDVKIELDESATSVPVLVYSGTHLGGDYNVTIANVTSFTYASGVAHITFDI